MDTKYARLISLDKLGNPVAIHPEVECDEELDSTSSRPLANKAISSLLSGMLTADSLQDILGNSSGGIYWNQEENRLEINLSDLSAERLKEISSALTETNGFIYADSSTGKLKADFSKLDSRQVKDASSSLTETNGVIYADSSTGKLKADFSKMSADQIRNLILSLISDGGKLYIDDNGKLEVDCSQIESITTEYIRSLFEIDEPADEPI